MRSSVEIVADAGSDGRPVLARLHGSGQLAVRTTGPGRVHLVGTAAGPLGGDTVEVTVRVRAGAVLAVHGVAASIALPGRDGDRTARVVTRLDVEDGGRLVYVPPPLVVCRGARLETVTVLALAGDGCAEVAEQVVLGRHGEAGGTWRGRLVADRDALPLLRTTQTSALVETTRLPGARTGRALVTWLTVRVPADGDVLPAGPPDPVHGGAVRCTLAAGGELVTSIGADLTSASLDARAVLGTDGPAVDLLGAGSRAGSLAGSPTGSRTGSLAQGGRGTA